MISFWWLVGLAQLTLGLAIGLIFLIAQKKILNDKNAALKKLVQDAQGSLKQLAKDQALALQEAQAQIISPTEAFEAIQNSIITELEDVALSIRASIEPLDFSALTQTNTPKETLVLLRLTLSRIEQHLSQNSDQDAIVPDKALIETHFFEQLKLNPLLVNQESLPNNDVNESIESLVQKWPHEKARLLEASHELAKLTQKNADAQAIHHYIELLFNSFTDLLAYVPGIEKETIDPFLNMEPTAEVETEAPLDMDMSILDKPLEQEQPTAPVQSAQDIEDILAGHQAAPPPQNEAEITGLEIDPNEDFTAEETLVPSAENHEEIIEALETAQEPVISSETSQPLDTHQPNVDVDDILNEFIELDALISQNEDSSDIDQVSPLSHFDIEEDLDELDQPVPVIEEFIEPQQKQVSQPKTNTSETINTEENQSAQQDQSTEQNQNTEQDQSTEQDKIDDMFGDLLDTMDEVMQAKSDQAS